MAKVTMVFEDCVDGVSLEIKSDPPFPDRKNLSHDDKDLTEAQHMALGLAHRMSQAASEEIEDIHEGHACCGRHKSPGGDCSRHQDKSENSCQH